MFPRRLYCNDSCRARDGQSKQPTTGLQLDASPLILASLPGVLASRARESYESTAFGSSGHPSTTHTSTSRASSQSATFSPLQSPSPFAAREQAGVSPQENIFHVPPLAYPTAPIGFSPGLSASSHLVKIPASLRGLPAVVPSPQRATLDLAHLGAEVGTASTLHYGRRPGVTNSITSPLALFAVGGSYSSRRESNRKLSRSVPNALGLSPSEQSWSLHRMRSSTVNVSNERIVSDSSSGLHAHGMGRQTAGYINYGPHSPLIAATNRLPAFTSAVDASEAQGSLTSTASTVGTIVGIDPLSSSVQKVNVITPFGSELVVNVDGAIKTVNASYFGRRRSSPLQANAPRMSPTTAQAPAKKATKTATAAIEDDLDLSDSDDDDDRRRRGRSRELRDSSVARREMSGSDRDHHSSAASYRGESRRRSRGRSPSGPRNRRQAD